MKLLQARFPLLSKPQWEAVAAAIRSVLENAGDSELTAISVAGRARSEPDYEAVSLDRMTELLATSFAASQKRRLDHPAEIVTIKSSRSCRFVVTEDDGLIRICLAAEDPEPDFSAFGAVTDDVSHLLVETDLFDHF